MQNWVVMTSLSSYLCDDWAAHKGTYYHRWCHMFSPSCYQTCCGPFYQDQQNLMFCQHVNLISGDCCQKLFLSPHVGTKLLSMLLRTNADVWITQITQMSFHCLFFFWGAFMGSFGEISHIKCHYKWCNLWCVSTDTSQITCFWELKPWFVPFWHCRFWRHL